VLHRFKPKSEFSRNIVTLITGTGIAQIIPIVISPVLTRLYSPSDFGTFAFFSALVGILSILASGRYEMALLLPKREQDALHILFLSFILNLLFSLIVLGGIIIFHDILMRYIDDRSMELWLYVVPLSVFVVALFNQLSIFNNRLKCYADMARASVIKSFVLSVVQLGTGIWHTGVSGLIGAQIIAQLSANVKLAKNILLREHGNIRISRLKLFALAKRYRDFPRYNLPHAVLSTLSANLPIYLFTPFFGSQVVGYYSLSLMIVFVPLMIIAGATAKVYNQQISIRYRQREESYLFTKRMLRSLAAKIVPVVVLIGIFSPSLFGMVFGENWREAGIYTQILVPFLLLNVMVSTVAFIPNLVGKQKKAFWISVVHVILLGSVLVYFASTHKIYSALIALSIVNSAVLLYNLSWMLQSLKSER